MYKVYWFDYKGAWAIAAGSSEEDAVRACHEQMSHGDQKEDIEKDIEKFLAFRAEKAKYVEVVSLLEGVSSEKRGCLTWLP